jgi:maleate isomerase
MSPSGRGAPQGPQTIIGALSGRTIVIPDANKPPMPKLAVSGVIHDGRSAENFGLSDGSHGYPDVRSFRRKFGLLIPATNTSMEHELWSIIGKNPGSAGLDGIGIHTANVITPSPKFGNAEEIDEYRRQFLGGLKSAVEQIELAEPQYLIMGMSIEHIVSGIDRIRASMAEIEASTTLSWAMWHDASVAALKKLGAKRIGLLTPFETVGNENAQRMFEDLGFDVVSTVGFSCEYALHVAHLPDWAKEKAIVELLATPANRLDAVVQCGTNMSLMQVSEKLEPMLGIPIIGINAALFWYALRENGFANPLAGGGTLLRDY